MMPHPIAESVAQRLGESLQHAASVARACRSLEIVEYTLAQPARWFTASWVDRQFGGVQKDIVLPYRRGLRGIGFGRAIEGALRPDESPHDLSIVIVPDCESMEPRDARQILASMEAWRRAERGLRERGASAPRGVLVLLVGRGPFHLVNPTRPDPFPAISALVRGQVCARVSLPDTDMDALHGSLFGDRGAFRQLQSTVSRLCGGRQLLVTDRALESIVQATQVTPWGRDSAMQVVADIARHVIPVASLFPDAEMKVDIRIEVDPWEGSLRVGLRKPG